MASRGPASAPRAGGRPRPWQRRASTWVALAAGSLLALGGGLLLGLWLLLGHLDHPWVKGKLLAACRDQLGLGVDYDGLEVSLRRGIRARSLRLLTPASLAAGATDFVRIDGLELRAPLWRFAFGRRVVERLAIGRIEVAWVRDASGHDTLSELFPEPAEPEPSQPAHPSRLLAELPELSIETLAIEAIAARAIEIGPGGVERRLSLGDLRASGALHSEGHGLSGSTLALGADPLWLEIVDRDGSRRAELTLSVELGAPSDAALELRTRLGMRSQDLLPQLPTSAELLALDASLGFDAGAGKTSLAIAPLHALSDAVTLDAHAELFDEQGLSARLGGSAHVALEQSPLVLPGAAFEGLRLDASARELSWDGARVVGDVDARGSLGRLALDAPEAGGSLRLRDVTLLALGTFEPSGGRFHATLGAAEARLAGAGSSAEISDAGAIISATARDAAGVQQIEASATLSLDAARIAGDAAGTIALDQARLHAVALGPTPELARERVPHLEIELSAASVTQAASGRRTQIERPTASAVIEHLVLAATNATGVTGDATGTLRVPVVRVLEGPRNVVVAARGLELSAALPLSLDSLQGSLSLDALSADDNRVGGLSLALEASTPLGWGDGGPGGQALARGTIAHFEAAGARGTLAELRLSASKAAPDRYGLELDARGTSLAVSGQALPPIVANVRAYAAPSEGSLAVKATLAGTRGGSLALDGRARFERATEILRYDLGLSAAQLEAFAEAASGLDRRAAQLSLQGAALRASAHGEVAGVLQRGQAGWPEPAPHPLHDLRGKQSASLRLEGLDYRGPGRTLRIPHLELSLDSTIGEGGRGNASARASLPTLELEGGGSSLRLTGLTQTLDARFERAPDQGFVDVDASLELASAAQSFAPRVPLRDLRLTSHMQIDRLRSIFLRELSLDNPASGSSLRAAGTLELLAQMSHVSDATLAGREALFFEGRLVQRLEPFETLGVASHASGTVEVPFRLESGALLGYRLLAALEAKDVSWVSADRSLAVEGVNGTVPVVEELTLLDGGPVLSAGPRTSPLSDTRFFDVHPFLSGHDYVTADSIRFGAMQPLGPIAANVRVERSDFLIDQLQAGYSGGQIVGQVRVAYRDDDPIVRMRLNATGVRSGKKREVFDANAALTFVPRAMTLDGKAQIVRASRDHLEDILDVIDPFHESANANRVRQGLTLGYPKFVRFQFHDGAIDTKVELGGLAELVRIDEIKAVPLGPILQKYVAPTLAEYLKRPPPANAWPASAPEGTPAGGLEETEPSARGERKGRSEP